LSQHVDRLLSIASDAIAADDTDAARDASQEALTMLGDADGRKADALSLLGLSLVRSDPAQSIRLLTEAVERKPEKTSLRVNLGQVLVGTGRTVDGIRHLEQASRQSHGHPSAVIPLADAYAQSGRLEAADSVLSKALEAAPLEDLLRKRAEIRYRAGDLHAADEFIGRVIEASEDPRPSDLLTQVRLVIQLADFERAEVLVEALLEKTPHEPAVVAPAVRAYDWQGKADRANEILSAALAEHPDDPRLIELALTQSDELAAEVRGRAEAIVASLPDDATLKTVLLYPLARFYDRQGELDRAWQTMLQANDLARRRRKSTANPDEVYTQLSAYFSRALAKSSGLVAESTEGPAFIYLCGAPRTGSTLIQTMLAAHRNVASVGERGALLRQLGTVAESADVGPLPGYLAELAKADLALLARLGYTSGAVVDKTPHNFYVLPLLRATHNRSVFINVVRDPRDVAISMLFHDFSTAFPEATDLEAIARMLRARAEGTRRYREAGIDLLTISYESFVDDSEQVGRRAAEFAGIEWEPDSLSAERRDSAVSNFSAGQVRKDIARPLGQRWRRFEDQLSDLAGEFEAIDALQREIED
jgi:tetratricopeptide (TPR) repeat protein